MYDLRDEGGLCCASRDIDDVHERRRSEPSTPYDHPHHPTPHHRKLNKQSTFRVPWSQSPETRKVRTRGPPVESNNTKQTKQTNQTNQTNQTIFFTGDLFIGTRSSNWCRLIDEIRKTNGKARAPFLSPEAPNWFFQFKK